MPTEKQDAGRRRKRSEYEWIMIYLMDGRICFSTLYKTFRGAEKQKSLWQEMDGCKAVLLSVADLMDWEKRGIGELERMLRL